MRIGIFTDTYKPQINGVVTSIVTLKEELERLGHEVFIFTAAVPGYKNKEKGVFCTSSLPFKPCPSMRLANPISLEITKVALSLKLDIIHTQTEFSIGNLGKFIAKLTKCPSVHTYHTLYEDYTHYILGHSLDDFKKHFTRSYSRFFCNRNDYIVAPTKKVYDLLESYGVNKPIEIIPTGIELNNFSKENYTSKEFLALRKSLGIKPDDKVLIYVGRLADEKNIDVIINELSDYIKEHSNIKLLLVGDGPHRSELEKLVHSNGLGSSVIFAGFKPLKEIGLYYQIANVFISASTSEAQGLTYLEAMAAGLTVIAKRDACLDWLISNRNNGCFFDKKEELPILVNNILSNSDFNKFLSKNAIKTSKLNSSSVFGKKVEELYKQALYVHNTDAI